MIRRIDALPSVFEPVRGSNGVTWSMILRIVWSGRIGSQDSIHWADGSNWPLAFWVGPPRLVVLFWRENVGVPAGRLPRAFSDMPRI